MAMEQFTDDELRSKLEDVLQKWPLWNTQGRTQLWWLPSVSLCTVRAAAWTRFGKPNITQV